MPRGASPFIGIAGEPIYTTAIAPQDEVTLALHPGVTGWNKFGYNDDIDSADGALFIIPTGAGKISTPEILTSVDTFDVAFDDTTDGLGTTGALTLAIYYIGDDGCEAIATHTLGATSPETTSFTGYGINRIAVASSGSADVNTGAITVTSTTGGGVQAYIPAGEGVTQQALFHTPSDRTGVAKLIFFNINKVGAGTPRVTLKGWVHSRTVDTKFEIFRYTMETDAENHVELIDPINFRLSPFDALYFTAETDVNNTVVNMRFSLNTYDLTEL